MVSIQYMLAQEKTNQNFKFYQSLLLVILVYQENCRKNVEFFLNIAINTEYYPSLNFYIYICRYKSSAIVSFSN